MTADSEKSPGVSNHRSFLQGRSICPEEGPPASLLLPHCCAALCSPAQGLRFHFPREGIYDHPRHRRGLRSDRSGKGSVPGHSPLASRLVSVSHVRSCCGRPRAERAWALDAHQEPCGAAVGKAFLLWLTVAPGPAQAQVAWPSARPQRPHFRPGGWVAVGASASSQGPDPLALSSLAVSKRGATGAWSAVVCSRQPQITRWPLPWRTRVCHFTLAAQPGDPGVVR